MIPSGLGSWLATYAAHSTVLLAVGLLVSRWVASPLAARRLVLLAILAAPLTTSLATLAWIDHDRGAPPPMAAATTSPAEPDRLTSPPGNPPAGPATRAVESAPTALRLQVAAPDWARLLPGAWLWLTLVGLAHLSITTVAFLRSMRRRARAFDDDLAPGLLEYVRTAHPRARLMTTSEFVAPMAVYPNTIVVPAWAACELSATELRAIVDHEAAHLIHRDPLWRMALAVLGRVLFFQPLQWAATRRLDVLAEQIADERAGRTVEARLALARSIVLVADRIEGRRLAACVAGFVRRSDASLLARVRRLVGDRAPAGRLPALVAGVAMLVMVAASTSLSIEGRAPTVVPDDPAHDERWIAWSTAATPWRVSSSTRDLRHIGSERAAAGDRLWMLARANGSGRIDAVWMSTDGPPTASELEGVSTPSLTNAESLGRLGGLRRRAATEVVASELGAAVAVHADWVRATTTARALLDESSGGHEVAEEVIQWLARRPPTSADEDEAVTALLTELAFRDGGGPVSLEAVDGLGQRAHARLGNRARSALTAIATSAPDAAVADEAAEWRARVR